MSLPATARPRPSVPRSVPSGPARHQRHASLLMVTDRLPGVRAEDDANVGIDGLPDDPVTVALEALVRRAPGGGPGAWIGRPWAAAEPLPWPGALRPLEVEDGEARLYDAGHARETLWPLYHDLVRPAEHDQRWRAGYRRVNRAFANAAADSAAPGATVWIHDYHLQLVPRLLRRLRPDLRIGFFAHTPFPAADLFEHMPMHQEVLAGLLGADLIGFQTAQAAENFLRLTQDGAGQPADREPPSVGVYPTSVDTAAIDAIVAGDDVARAAAELRSALGEPRLVLLSIDAADASRGVDRRLRALFELFGSGELDPQDIAVVQLVTRAPEAEQPDQVTDEIALEVTRINGTFASVGRPCVNYLISAPTLSERVILYRAADIMLATPLRDGSTLPALEFAAAGRPDAALVLSDFTGTAAVLPEAFTVNPYDEAALRAGVLAAVRAGPGERQHRMRAMRRYVAEYDTHRWARSFLTALPSHPAGPAAPPVLGTGNLRFRIGAST